MQVRGYVNSPGTTKQNSSRLTHMNLIDSLNVGVLRRLGKRHWNGPRLWGLLTEYSPKPIIQIKRNGPFLKFSYIFIDSFAKFPFNMREFILGPGEY